MTNSSVDLYGIAFALILVVFAILWRQNNASKIEASSTGGVASLTAQKLRNNISSNQAAVAEAKIAQLSRHPSDVANAVARVDLLQRLQLPLSEGGLHALILYGSQTGTAETFSERLVQSAAQYRLQFALSAADDILPDPQRRPWYKRLPEHTPGKTRLLFFLLATYGEGEPTDNSAQFYRQLRHLYRRYRKEDTKPESDDEEESGDVPSDDEVVPDGLPLKHVRYCMFGLGDKSYLHFNRTSRRCDRWLRALGAKPIVPLTFGDDDANIEDDYVHWVEQLWPEVCPQFGVDATPQCALSASFKLQKCRFTEDSEENEDSNENVVTLAKNDVYQGEWGILRRRAAQRVRKTFDAKNPFDATLMDCRELNQKLIEQGEILDDDEWAKQFHSDCPSSFYHVRIQLSDAVVYQAGDHLGLFARNDPKLVEELGRVLNLADLDVPFQLIPVADESSAAAPRRVPVPCPTTFRHAFGAYVDLHAPVKPHLIAALAVYAQDEYECKYLTSLSASRHRASYQKWIVQRHIRITDLLSQFKSVRVPVEHLLELLPRMTCRYYSIASSPRAPTSTVNNQRIAELCISRVRYVVERSEWPTYDVTSDQFTSQERNQVLRVVIHGLVSQWLGYAKKANEPIKVPVFVRRSTFKLPRQLQQHVIMIGPGTGVAPLRSFIQERQVQLSRQLQTGDMYLFTGCRRRDEDNLYANEWEEALNQGVLRQRFAAFSREQSSKVYVQHLITQQASLMWTLVKEGASVYVCGDAKSMAKQVMDAWHSLIAQGLMEEDASLSKEASLEKSKAFVLQMRASGRYVEDVW